MLYINRDVEIEVLFPSPKEKVDTLAMVSEDIVGNYVTSTAILLK